MYLNLEKKTIKTITIRIIQTPKTKNLTPKKSPPPLKITIHEITPKNKHKLTQTGIEAQMTAARLLGILTSPYATRPFPTVIISMRAADCFNTFSKDGFSSRRNILSPIKSKIPAVT